jgi:C4-dicarboxylate transporter
MIDNNSLGNILNTHRKNKSKSEEPTISNSESNQSSNSTQPPIIELINSLLMLIGLGIKFFAFGYTLKLFMHTDWNVFSIFCIGFSVTFFLEYLAKILDFKSKTS